MKAQPQQTEQAPTLPERLAAAHANKERFSRIAADLRRDNQDGSGASIRMRELRRARDAGRA